MIQCKKFSKTEKPTKNKPKTKGKKKMHFNTSVYTGKILEDDVLGTCEVKWNGRTQFCKEVSIEIARMHQPWDPANPKSEDGRRLQRAVADDLGVEANEVKIFTAVTSPLDKQHRTDGWIEFQGVVVAIDVTISRHKDWNPKAIIVPMTEVENGFEFVAQEIADSIRWGLRIRNDQKKKVAA